LMETEENHEKISLGTIGNLNEFRKGFIQITLAT
jgi:hypothetical protein